MSDHYNPQPDDPDYQTTAELNEEHYYAGVEADMQQAQYEAEGRQLSAMRRKGICTHGSFQGSHPEFAPDVPKGHMVCTAGCGGLWPDVRGEYPAAGDVAEKVLAQYLRDLC